MSVSPAAVRDSLVSIYSNTGRHRLVMNIAMCDALSAVHYARCYGEASRAASSATGRDRCYWAGLASAYARRARKAAKQHNTVLASFR